MFPDKKTNEVRGLWRFLKDKYQKKTCRTPRSVWTNPIHFIACGFGVGCIPFMPGTFGTLASIPFIFILNDHLSWISYLIVCALLLGVGVYVTEKTNKAFGTQDHPAAVIDEFATFPIALFAIPLTLPLILLGFILFRFFDIVKPGPIRWVDKNIHGGIGVMLDDLLAALATLAVLHFIIWVLGI